eukprot:m.53522 g.53522  ORF g.53522 m.53522 type:complete len:78 (+) comp21772_c0_seq3:592-825(+)
MCIKPCFNFFAIIEIIFDVVSISRKQPKIISSTNLIRIAAWLQGRSGDNRDRGFLNKKTCPMMANHPPITSVQFLSS